MSIEHLAERFDQPRAKVIADALDAGTTQYLMNNKSPSRKVTELDNRGSHFYLAMYWAQALAAQDGHAELKTRFAKVAQALADNEAKIVDELNAAQGDAQDVGGYFWPNDELAGKAMRPSATLNAIIAEV